MARMRQSIGRWRSGECWRATACILLALFAQASVARLCPDWSQRNASKEHRVVVRPPQDVFPRYDILQVIYKKQLSKHLDLLIQAFIRLQDRPSTSPVSYFQLAAIHGQPFEAWDGVKTSDAKLANMTEPMSLLTPGKHSEFAGYCWHASVLFPTWHRAYSLLFEQEIREEAMAIAHEYDKSERREYIEAAYQLRLPYWDWIGEHAAHSGLPEFLLLAEVEVNTPRGREHVRNPFESFTFPEDVFKGVWGHERGMKPPEGVKINIGTSPSMRGDGIARHPNEFLTNNYNRLQEDLTVELGNYIRPAVETLLDDKDVGASWAKFATHKPTHSHFRPRSTLKDIEGIHDTVHDILGGIVFVGERGFPGHMSDVNVAAYDPLFFLVHTNLDRITQLYQQRYPNSWLEYTKEEHVRNYMAGHNGFDVDGTTPLWPFRKSQTEFFSSNDVRNISHLGYTYPEFVPDFSLDNMTSKYSPSFRHEASVLPIIDCDAQSNVINATNTTSSDSKSNFEQVAHLFRRTHQAIFKRTHVFESNTWCPHSSLPWCRTKL